jgi:hypothetical protein
MTMDRDYFGSHGGGSGISTVVLDSFSRAGRCAATLEHIGKHPSRENQLFTAKKLSMIAAR